MPLQIYAVWFNMMWSDARSEWPRDVLADPRVAHFWDENKIVGRWYARNVTSREGEPDAVEWDAYFLYGPDALWSDRPPEAVGWNRPIIATTEGLREGLLSKLS